MIDYSVLDQNVVRETACLYIVYHKTTLRKAGEEYGIPTSTLDWWVHNKLKHSDPQLYKLVCDQFKENLKNMKGWNKYNGEDQHKCKLEQHELCME